MQTESLAVTQKPNNAEERLKSPSTFLSKDSPAIYALNFPIVHSFFCAIGLYPTWRVHSDSSSIRQHHQWLLAHGITVWYWDGGDAQQPGRRKRGQSVNKSSLSFDLNSKKISAGWCIAFFFWGDHFTSNHYVAMLPFSQSVSPLVRVVCMVRIKPVYLSIAKSSSE